MQATPTETRSSLRYAYLVVLVLTLVNIFNFLDRQILTILAEPIRKDLGLSDTQLGLLTGLAFALFYTTFGIPVAWIADRSNRVRIVAAACSIWSLFTLASGLANNFWQLALARIGVGVGEAGGSPPSYSLIADYFPPHRRGGAVAIYALGIPLGTLLGSAGGGWVAAEYGWRAAFFAVGAPGLALALLTLIVVREPKRGGLDKPVDGAAEHAPSMALIASVKTFLANRTLCLTALSCGLSAFCGYAKLSWFPAFLIRNQEMSLTEIALWYSLVSGLAGALGTFSSGFVVDRLSRISRRAYALVPAAAFAISLPFFVGFLFAPTWQTSLLFLIVPSFLNNVWLAPSLTLVQNTAAPAQRTISSALLLFVLNLLGLGGGPLYVGLVSDAVAPQFGERSLQIGLLALAPWIVLTILVQYATSRSILRDIRAEAGKAAEEARDLAPAGA